MSVGSQQAAVNWEGQEDCKGGDIVSKRCESKNSQLHFHKGSYSYITAYMLPVCVQYCCTLLTHSLSDCTVCYTVVSLDAL